MRLFQETLVLLALAAAAHSFFYLGCYPDTGDLYRLNQSPFQSVGLCRNACAPHNGRFFGVRNATECWCGSTFPGFEDELDPTVCNLRCPGYPQDACGGRNALNYYVIEDEPTTTHSLSPSPTPSPDFGIQACAKI
ncbi:WSC domain-containing protein [Aspergillus unguis]